MLTTTNTLIHKGNECEEQITALCVSVCRTRLDLTEMILLIVFDFPISQLWNAGEPGSSGKVAAFLCGSRAGYNAVPAGWRCLQQIQTICCQPVNVWPL